MEKKPYHHENLREELIDAGVRLVTQEGEDALSLRRLAMECGVSHAAPYKHFQGKEDILRAVVGRMYGLFTAELCRTLEGIAEENPRTRLLELGKCYIRFFLNRPEYLKLMFFHGRVQATPDMLRAGGETEWGALAVFRNTALDYLRSVQADPGDDEYRIISLWALVHGLTLMLANGNWAPDEPIAEAMEKALTSFF